MKSAGDWRDADTRWPVSNVGFKTTPSIGERVTVLTSSALVSPSKTKGRDADGGLGGRRNQRAAECPGGGDLRAADGRLAVGDGTGFCSHVQEVGCLGRARQGAIPLNAGRIGGVHLGGPLVGAFAGLLRALLVGVQRGCAQEHCIQVEP